MLDVLQKCVDTDIVARVIIALADRLPSAHPCFDEVSRYFPLFFSEILKSSTASIEHLVNCLLATSKLLKKRRWQSTQVLSWLSIPAIFPSALPPRMLPSSPPLDMPATKEPSRYPLVARSILSPPAQPSPPPPPLPPPPLPPPLDETSVYTPLMPMEQVLAGIVLPVLPPVVATSAPIATSLIEAKTVWLCA